MGSIGVIKSKGSFDTLLQYYYRSHAPRQSSSFRNRNVIVIEKATVSHEGRLPRRTLLHKLKGCTYCEYAVNRLKFDLFFSLVLTSPKACLLVFR